VTLSLSSSAWTVSTASVGRGREIQNAEKNGNSSGRVRPVSTASPRPESPYWLLRSVARK
jgi:hypothetical protein